MNQSRSEMPTFNCWVPASKKDGIFPSSSCPDEQVDEILESQFLHL